MRMKFYKWYMSAVLSLIMTLLLIIAVELNTLNSYTHSISTVNNLPTTRESGMPEFQKTQFQPSGVLNVRLVGVRVEGSLFGSDDLNFGPHFSGLPVMLQQPNGQSARVIVTAPVKIGP